MRRLIVIALLAVACGDNKTATPQDAAVGVGPCLDEPTTLLRPPTGQLPCELLPPGFVPQ
jgi:hypothetical protein